MYVRIHICVYLIGPILVFICRKRINIRPCDEKNSIERREEKHVTGKIECVKDMAAVCLIEPPPPTTTNGSQEQDWEEHGFMPTNLARW